MKQYKEITPEQYMPILESLKNNLFIVEDLLYSEKTHVEILDRLYGYMRQAFEVQEIRRQTINFKFKKTDTYIHTLNIRHFIPNLMMWAALIELGVQDRINEFFIFDCTKETNPEIENYINTRIIIPFRSMVSNSDLNEVCSNIIERIKQIPQDFNIILGLSISMEGLMMVANKCPEFNMLIRDQVDPNLQPTEIERQSDEKKKRLIEILMEQPNILRPMLITGSGINKKQLGEFATCGTLKPDLDGKTIPVPINSNFVVGGLKTVTNYYIDSLGGRKAVIMNKMSIGKSGHFSRKIMLLNTDTKLSRRDQYCDTVTPIMINIKTKQHLKRLAGRWYKPLGRFGKEFVLLRGDETKLIGRDVLIKSPITCNCKNGICHTCYGELSISNYNINSIGGLAGAKATEPISQKILSVKHLLSTNSKMIKFKESFYNLFNVNSNEIILNEDSEINFDDYTLILLQENITMIDEYSLDRDFNRFVSIFHIRNDKTGEIEEFREEDELDLYFSNDFNEIIESKRPKSIDVDDDERHKAFEIKLSSIETGVPIFVVEVQNKEIIKPLNDIMALLDKEDHNGCDTIDSMAQRFLDLLIESDINIMSVHGELLLRPLIRKKNDILEPPIWNSYKHSDNYQILTITKALIYHPSVTISLSFQELGRQLVNPLTFKKNKSSFIDPFFKQRP